MTTVGSAGSQPLDPGAGFRRDPPEAIQHLLELARQHLQMELAFAGRFIGKDEMFEVVVGDEHKVLIQQGSAIPLSESYCRRMADGSLSCHVPDARADDRVNKLDVTKSANIGAYIGVPIVFSDGRLYGAFCCLSSQPEPSLTERDAQFLKVLAGLASEELERQEERDRKAVLAGKAVETLLAPGVCRSVFQPVQELWTREVLGFEALSRFDSEPRRTPDVWFKEAWEHGLGTDLEVHAIRTALAEAEKLPRNAYISFNVSPETILCGAAGKALADARPGRFVLEITEHAVVDDYEALAKALEPLRSRGVWLAIDDAGAGYASLRHILQLHPDAIKMDMSLTRGIDDDAGLLALASALTSFAARINVAVVAEGVETESEASALRALGVHFGQGYLVGRPAPAEELASTTRV